MQKIRWYRANKIEIGLKKYVRNMEVNFSIKLHHRAVLQEPQLHNTGGNNSRAGTLLTINCCTQYEMMNH